MKQINGTITLSFLEEDNQQRVIFRVVPLCTREGVVFRDKTVDFPDQGSLRIVPDKREQSTFKERMRSMGSLCAIQLCSEGKELAKVRQNRNYDPGQGENNQFAIYSDVICEFAEDGVFEVFAEGADISKAFSPAVLLRRGQILYGPVSRETTPDPATLRPFGNDCYLLHTVDWGEGGEHSFYWNPELTVSWRQRRGTLRRGKARPEETAEDAEAAANAPEASATVAVKPQPVKPAELPNAQAAPSAGVAETRGANEGNRTAQPRRMDAVAPVNERPAPKAPERPVAERIEQTQPSEPMVKINRLERRQETHEDTAMPIGTRLTILDGSIPFEEQISKLDQPLSNEANLLSRIGGSLPTESDPGQGRTAGTPLVRMGVKAPQPIRRGEALHYVVDRQIRSAHREHAEADPDIRHVDNPIENLHAALEKVWQTPETRRQALQSLCENEAFMVAFRKHLQQQGNELNAVQAAQEQLEDIEAERLSLLMQLEATRTDVKRATEAMLADLSQKKRETLTRLDQQLQTLNENRERLLQAVAALGDDAQRRTCDWLAENHLQLCICNGETVALAPTVGIYRTPAEMVASVRAALNRQGFACNEDDVTELLLHFALSDEICLCGDTLPEAELCASTFLEGLGLRNVTARTDERTRLEVASMLPDNGLRTPTVEVCGMERAALRCFGHKTIRILDAHTPLQAGMPLPMLYTPVYRPSTRDGRPVEPLRPTSLESFDAFRDEAKPLLNIGEAWFVEVEKKISEQSPALAGFATQAMRLFVSAASGKLRGGFLAAADAAMLSWVIPEVYRRELNPEPFHQEIISLPRCMAALGIR